MAFTIFLMMLWFLSFAHMYETLHTAVKTLYESFFSPYICFNAVAYYKTMKRKLRLT